MSEASFGKTVARLFSRVTFTPEKETANNVPSGYYPSPYLPDHAARQKKYALYWDYYMGNQRPPLKDDNLNQIENYCMAVVDLSRRFLINDGVRFEIDGSEQSQTEEEKNLSKVISKRVQVDVAQSGAITGLPALRIFPQGDGELPRVVVVDPSSLEIFTGADKDVVNEYRQTWWDGMTWQRQRMMNRNGETGDLGQTLTGWEIVSESRAKDGKWVETDREAWAYMSQPMYHAQNLPIPFGIYGLSDLSQAALQDSINATASDTRKILHHHAAPTTIAEGMQGHSATFSGSDGGAKMYKTPTGTRLYNLEMQSDLSSSVAHKDSAINTFYAITSTPRLDSEQVQLGAVSGFALQLSMMPALLKMDDKRMTYGKLFDDVSTAVLEIMGIVADVSVVFSNPLPQDEDAAVTRFTALVAAGVDKYEAARRAGYDIKESESLAARSITLPVSPISTALGTNSNK